MNTPLVRAFLCLCIIIAISACKQENVDELTLPNNPSKETLARISKIRDPQIKALAEFIEIDMVDKSLIKGFKHHGEPMWEHVLESADDDGREFIIPFSKTGGAVNAILVCQKLNGAYHYKFATDELLQGAKSRRLNSKGRKMLGLLLYANASIFKVEQYDLPSDVLREVRKATLGSKLVVMVASRSAKARNTTSGWESYVKCTSTNANCNCPSTYVTCDRCPGCMVTECELDYIWVEDRTIQEDYPGGGGGGTPSGGPQDEYYEEIVPPAVRHLLVLNLTVQQKTFLTENIDIAMEISTQYDNSSDPSKTTLFKDDIEFRRTNSDYQQFTEDYATATSGSIAWWENSTWLSHAANFNFDLRYNYLALTAEEKLLVKKYPIQAYRLRIAATTAKWRTGVLFGIEDAAGDKSDAFRHAFWAALGEMLIGTNSANQSITKLFLDAHETATPFLLWKEWQMDNFNNAVGITLGYGTSSEIEMRVLNRLHSGDLRYLKPRKEKQKYLLDQITINPNYDPDYNGENGTFNINTATHGITTATQLVPTNQ
jgi:hypothetical protein